MNKSNQQFSALDADKDGYVSGKEGFHFFMQSGISAEVLATIWEMADINKDGRLDSKVISQILVGAHFLRSFVWLYI